MALSDFAPLWDDLFRRGAFDPEGIDPVVEEFFAELGPGAGRALLDAGCGTGRHLLLAMDKGFQAFGADASAVAVGLLKQRVAARNRRAELRVARLAHLPFPDASFDAIVCVDVVHHGRLAEIRKGLAELTRTLKPGGRLLCTVASREDPGWCDGEQVEPGTFVAATGNEAGIPRHHFEERELAGVFEGLGITRVTRVVGPETPASVRLAVRAVRP